MPVRRRNRPGSLRCIRRDDSSASWTFAPQFEGVHGTQATPPGGRGFKSPVRSENSSNCVNIELFLGPGAAMITRADT